MSPRSSFDPMLNIHLIDGNPHTYWSSKGRPYPDVEPQWIRIDFPKIQELKEIILVPKEEMSYFDGLKPYGDGIPPSLKIELAAPDLYPKNWTTVYQASEQVTPLGRRPPRRRSRRSIHGCFSLGGESVVFCRRRLFCVSR